ncbi:MAG: class I SAM-dependent methyltransferase [Nocardioidaceae bacterium]
MAQRFEVGSGGIRLPRDLDRTLDVLFDGIRVWSFHGTRSGRRADGAVQVDWPPALRPHLDGVAGVTLVTHDDQQPLFSEDVRFGDGHGRVRVRDTDGHPLSVDKSGRLQRDFSHVGTDLRTEIVDAVEKVLHDLRGRCGVDAYLAYGALLGAVRNGHLIGHDADADVAYLSRWRHPFDLVRESRALSRQLAGLGWRVMRMSGANFKVWLPLPDGRRCGIDVFASFYIGDSFHVMGSLRGTLDPSVVLPLSSVTLEGRELAAPADPAAFLEFTYGPGWRTPDPAFHFDHAPADVARMDAMFRAGRRRLRYWHTFYRSPAVRRVPSGPSPFARWVAGQLGDGERVVDVGCGTGRDALWFAAQGHPVLAADYAADRKKLRRLARKQDAQLVVDHLNLEDLRATWMTGARLAHDPQVRHVYARGLLDTLAPSGRQNLWRFASMVQRRGGHTFLEFRTGASRDEPMHFGEHIRTWLEPDAVVREIEDHNGTVVERVIGRDLAPLGNENPEICRLVVRWTR